MKNKQMVKVPPNSQEHVDIHVLCVVLGQPGRTQEVSTKEHVTKSETLYTFTNALMYIHTVHTVHTVCTVCAECTVWAILQRNLIIPALNGAKKDKLRRRLLDEGMMLSIP